MKSFYFKLPSKKQDNNGTLKEYIINKIADKYPWLSMDGIDGPKSYSSLQYAGPEDYIAFDASPKYDVCAVRPYSWEQYKPSCPCYKCPFDIFDTTNKYDLASEFDIAMKKLDEYAYNKGYYDKGYDYKWFGLPVKAYQNFIQVGNTFIPKKNNTYIIPSDLSIEQKTTINNVIINIYNIINEAA